MKKLVFVTAILFFATTTIAQVKFGAEFGITYSNPKSNYLSLSIDDAWVPGVGIRAGALADINITDEVYFRTGLSFEQKRNSFTYVLSNGQGAIGEIKDVYTLNYLTLPLKLYYTMKGRVGGVIAGLGPEVGLGTKASVNTYTSSPSFNGIKTNFAFGNERAEINPLDVGVGIIIGYRFNAGFGVLATVTYGTKNLSNVESKKWYNRASGITLYYMLR